MDNEELKEQFSKLFRNGDIAIKLVTTSHSGNKYIFPVVEIDGEDVFVGLPEQY